MRSVTLWPWLCLGGCLTLPPSVDVTSLADTDDPSADEVDTSVVDTNGWGDPPDDVDTGQDAAGRDTGDGGDACPAGETRTCSGLLCLPSDWIGDGECDVGVFDCAATGWDGGDCDPGGGGGQGSCGPGEVPTCSGLTCVPARWVGDGVCDVGLLDCAATGWDGGDCGGGGGGLSCGANEVADCAGSVCLPRSWLGDGWCDSWLDCAATGWDGGDCP